MQNNVDSPENLLLHNQDVKPCPIIGVELVELSVQSLKVGKAAGMDELTAEYFQFCHPLVLCCIARLFNIMLSCQYIPAAFGQGIIIPIPKGDAKSAVGSCSEYRHITISCIISKIFEQCLLVLVNNKLVSSDRQFGFKKGVGCQHAIFSIRKVVDYFAMNGSTVNLCSLDLAKAFDRVNHDILFSKLLKKGLPKWFVDL